jgi:hypothetical protein
MTESRIRTQDNRDINRSRDEILGRQVLEVLIDFSVDLLACLEPLSNVSEFKKCNRNDDG